MPTYDWQQPGGAGTCVLGSDLDLSFIAHLAGAEPGPAIASCTAHIRTPAGAYVQVPLTKVVNDSGEFWEGVYTPTAAGDYKIAYICTPVTTGDAMPVGTDLVTVIDAEAIRAQSTVTASIVGWGYTSDGRWIPPGETP